MAKLPIFLLGENECDMFFYMRRFCSRRGVQSSHAGPLTNANRCDSQQYKHTYQYKYSNPPTDPHAFLHRHIHRHTHADAHSYSGVQSQSADLQPPVWRWC